MSDHQVFFDKPETLVEMTNRLDQNRSRRGKPFYRQNFDTRNEGNTRKETERG